MTRAPVETSRSRVRGGLVADWRMDARHTVRALRRSPAFTIIAVATLAIGIGATTAVMSIVDHVVLHSLPFHDANRLVMLLERGEKGGFRTPSAPTAADWQRDPAVRQALEDVAFVPGWGVTLRRSDGDEHIGAAYVGPEFFPLLGARPAIGRFFTTDDHRPDAPAVAVLAYEKWQKLFGGDPSIIGRRVSIDSVPTTIVGVMPLGGQYPGFADVWEPLSQYKQREALTRRALHADSRTIGRLRPGVDSARAVALMSGVEQRLAREYPAEQEHWQAAMQPVRDEVLGGVAPTLYLLAGAAAGILLLACANVAGLLLARAASRSRELAIRAALGASRGRIARQLLTENLVLATIGGVLGTGLGAFTIALARSLPPGKLPRVQELAIDGRVFLVAAIATAATALLCGAWPALRASRPAALDVLRGSGGSIGVRRAILIRRALVVAQFAVAMVLLVGGALLLQSFRRALLVDVGFDPRGLVSVRIDPPRGAYPSAADAAALYDRLMQTARAIPGVTDAAFVNHRPFGAASILSAVETEGPAIGDSASRQVLYRTVSASYRSTLKLSMAAGRWFDESDIRSPGGAFVINEAMARAYWPGQSAIGKRLTVHRSSQARPDFGQRLPGTVIGVIADVRQFSQDALPQPEVYVPYTLDTWGWGNLIVRARDAAHVAPALRAAIRALDPRLIEDGAKGDERVDRMDDSIAAAIAPRRLSMSVVSAFAACALLLAAIGMYGVVSYGIAQRTRELGVRKALGATDAMIASLVMRESFTLTALGVVFGAAGAWAGARLIRGLLYDTGAADPGAYAGTIMMLGVVAAIATWAPARRATRLDPTIAMRGE